jgi:hypothetical protein
VITNEVQRRATEAHLRQFEEALFDLEATHGGKKRSKLAPLEIHAVRSQPDELRAEFGAHVSGEERRR